jgi:hypothetical protein
VAKRTHQEKVDAVLTLATAHHEASHIVVAYELDGECHEVEVYIGGGGRCIIPPMYLFSDLDVEGKSAFLGYNPASAVIAAAGRVGHTRFFREWTGNPKTKPSEDHFSSDDRQVRSYLKHDRTAIRAARKEAKRLVDEHWSMIVKLAREIVLNGGNMRRREIEDCLPTLMRAKEARLQERLRIARLD